MYVYMAKQKNKDIKNLYHKIKVVPHVSGVGIETIYSGEIK